MRVPLGCASTSTAFQCVLAAVLAIVAYFKPCAVLEHALCSIHAVFHSIQCSSTGNKTSYLVVGPADAFQVKSCLSVVPANKTRYLVVDPADSFQVKFLSEPTVPCPLPRLLFGSKTFLHVFQW